MTDPSGPDWWASQQERFHAALARFRPDGPAYVLSHDDADGLSAGAILARALPRAGRPVRSRLVGRGESAWSDSMGAELEGANPAPAGLLVADLGTRAEPVLRGTETILIDHHVPIGWPDDGQVTAISGYGVEPIPCSSLLAFRAAAAVADVRDLLWLAALGLVGDFGERAASASFPEIMAPARRQFGAKALRDAAALVNAPRRASAGDAGVALALLLTADEPDDLLASDTPAARALRDAQAEVRAALEAARRVPPVFAGPVALIRLHSPCQVHPLVAQSWTGRLRRQIVMAANSGYREGFVHFAVRSAESRDLIAFLREHGPEPLGPDDQFANGHAQATGGVLRPETWERFLRGLGFGEGLRRAS